MMSDPAPQGGVLGQGVLRGGSPRDEYTGIVAIAGYPYAIHAELVWDGHDRRVLQLCIRSAPLPRGA